MFPKFINKCLFSTKNIVENHKIALNFIKKKEYKQAVDIYQNLIQENPKIYGTDIHMKILESQARCFYYLRDYNEYETNYLNAIEYAKNKINEDQKEYESLCYFYIQTIKAFIYSGNEKVLNIFLILIYPGFL